MRKEDKSVIVEQIGALLQQYPHFYLVDIEGMNAETTSALRRKCFQNNIKMVAVKNTLLKKALDANEADFSEMYGVLKGSTALIFAETANVPAKMLKKFNKDHQGVPALKAAYAEESIYVGAENLDALCAIKSKNELIAEVVAALEGQVQGVLGALESGASTIYGVLDTIAEKGE